MKRMSMFCPINSYLQVTPETYLRAESLQFQMVDDIPNYNSYISMLCFPSFLGNPFLLFEALFSQILLTYAFMRVD